MKGLGVCLTIIGLVWGIVAFNMNTAVPVDPVFVGSGYTSIREVNNVGLMDDRRNHLMGAAVTFLAGIMLIGFGSSQGTSSAGATVRQCPHCAEDIKAQAVLCKHCGKAVEPIAQQTDERAASIEPEVRKVCCWTCSAYKARGWDGSKGICMRDDSRKYGSDSCAEYTIKWA
jgi:hypothetical protein